MKFDHDIEAFIKDFVKDLLENNAAVFAGAGLSKSSGYVEWTELLRDIAEELGLEVDKEHDLISLAQYHVNHRGSNAGIAKKVLEEFSHQAEPSSSHEILARLPISTFWTTNYDSLLEESLKRAYKITDVKHSVSQLANTRPKRDVVVYKMHGDVTDPGQAVLSKHQYEQYFHTHAAFITALSGDLISKTFLFIGFSFTDPNLDYVLSRLHVTSPVRQHYCFMKKESGSKSDPVEMLAYKIRKQKLRVDDLKRYRIKALLVEDYADIPNILKEIEGRYRKKTVFVSGSAEEFGEWERGEAQDFVHDLSRQLVSSSMRVVNGFGWGIGSAVINGALEAVYSSPEKFSEDQLVIRPFPQFATKNQDLPSLWHEYRHRMMSLAGIAIFLFGNKKGSDGQIINADGVKREFDIAIEKGLIPIPVGATGYMAREIFTLIEKDPAAYYGDTHWIFPLVREIAAPGLPSQQIVEKLVSIVRQISK
ncbi:SIR2 family protein [Polaromonas sp.]|uniref:SIR2 family protein n=1 Tax=Polaromonas sp. TaxID=1869339 RepID=UPI002730DFEC|nr:SIR2 family protein [Polaromonas sp.]MDP1743107.1 SIR2 family protein [Polaromonas sp.]